MKIVITLTVTSCYSFFYQINKGLALAKHLIATKLVGGFPYFFGVLMPSFFKSKKKYLRIGLCLSEHSLSLVLIDLADKQAPRLSNSFYCEFAASSEGLESCSQQLSDFVESNNLKNINCYGVLRKKDYQLLLVEPPDVPESELLDAMKWKVKDLVSIDIDKTLIDIFPQPENKMLYTVIVDKSIIVRVVDLVKNAGLSLVSIDIEELSYRNFFSCLSFNNSLVQDRGLAVVNIDNDEGKLLIVKSGNIFLSRNFHINYGAGEFDDMPEDEIILELQRSLDYYERQMGQPAPAEIIFCGNVNEEKITSLMRDSFQQKISCVNLIPVVDKHHLQISSGDAVIISGAALRLQAAS